MLAILSLQTQPRAAERKQDPRIQHVNERPVKKQRLSSGSKDDVRRWQQEIILISGSVQRIKTDAEEADVALKNLLLEMQGKA